MEKLKDVFLFLAVLLLTGVNAALAQGPRVLPVGDTLTLKPPFSGGIDNLLWKHNGNLVVEWVKDKLDKTYGDFRNRTTMDKTTGELEIMKLTLGDTGVYTVEINKKDQGLQYSVKVMNVVSKPTVELKPLICPTQDECFMSCEGNTTGVEQIEYSWKFGDGAWENKGGMPVTITRADTKHIKRFTCRMKNPVSEEVSEPKDNPFFELPPNPTPGGVIAAIVLAILAIVLGGLGYWKRDYIKRKFRGDERDANAPVTLTGPAPNANTGNAPATGNGAKSPSANSSEPDENKALAANPV